MTARKSTQVVEDYKDDNSSAAAAIVEYNTEYKKLFDEEAKEKADQN